MRLIESNYTRFHAIVATVILALSVGIPFLQVQRSYTPDDNYWEHIAPALAVPLGPMAGAVVRDFQGCCLRASLSLLPIGFVGILLMLLPLIHLPESRLMTINRNTLFVLGLLTWLGCAFVSYLHALS